MRTLGEIADLLDLLPGKLAAKRLHVANAKQVVAARKISVDDKEAEAIAMASAELGETGKPRYTNKESREAAARKMLDADPAYGQARTALTEAEHAVQNEQIQLGMLEDEQRSLLAQIDAASAQLRRDAIAEFSRAVLDLARYEAGRMAQKETA